uniref:Sushi domain-containing protein n=1 Tax=Globodera pallida TaxID=36090 RepID=A0A183CIA2_GLOPA
MSPVGVDGHRIKLSTQWPQTGRFGKVLVSKLAALSRRKFGNSLRSGWAMECRVATISDLSRASSAPAFGHFLSRASPFNVKFFGFGADHLLCQPNGEWSQMLARCEPICKFPGTILHGRTTQSPREHYSLGERLVFFCSDNGYKLDAENVLECVQSGLWSRQKPRCVRIVAADESGGGGQIGQIIR